MLRTVPLWEIVVAMLCLDADPPFQCFVALGAAGSEPYALTPDRSCYALSVPCFVLRIDGVPG